MSAGTTATGSGIDARAIRLVLIRHPAVAIEPGICYGRSDISLAAPADASAVQIARRLSDEYPSIVPAVDSVDLYTSPLTRCSAVAAQLASLWDVPLHIDADLRELDYGDWELRRWDDVERVALDAWAADLEHGRPHGGESASMMIARIDRWVARVARTDTRTVVAVTHAGVIRLLAAHLLGEPIAVSLRRPLDFGAICRFQRDAAPSAGWTLSAWNETDAQRARC